MAGQQQGYAGGLEDHVRRMILSDGPSNSIDGAIALPDTNVRPAVRLPPTKSYIQAPQMNGHQQPQQPYAAYAPHNRGGGNVNFNGSSAGPPMNGYPVASYAPHARQQRGQPVTGNVPHGSMSAGSSLNGYPSTRHAPYTGGDRVRPPQARRSLHERPQYMATAQPASGFPGPQQRARGQQQMQLDPNAFQRGGLGRPPASRGQQAQQLFNPRDPRAQMPQPREQRHAQQTQYLETLAAEQIAGVEMTAAEYQEKDYFRATLERICLEVCLENPEKLPRISLEPFGSFKSGFAAAGSDMDLVIVIQNSASSPACFSLLEDDLPRVLEQRLLGCGIGARLLTRTRVPIIKVCELPGDELIQNLRQEREKWNNLPEKEKYPHLFETSEEQAGSGLKEQPAEELDLVSDTKAPTKKDKKKADSPQSAITEGTDEVVETGAINGATNEYAGPSNSATTTHAGIQAATRPRREDNKPWTRERKAGPLDFPKSGVGIQCDINFFNPLGLHNTQLLRCYALCDSRVRPMVLFVKAWAKHRRINSSYSGTLSSYGYVLMALHYLINVANPPVLPNLQAPVTPLGSMLPDGVNVDDWHVRFWRDEAEITAAAQRGQLAQNHESLGSLLVGFFHYYASQGGGFTFHWMQEVLSLRSQGGLLSKEEKGWVKAVTEEGEGKKIQHRYLFCIEDPFELSHNVARTVTHKGIVAIRDEFRRAHRILVSVGNGYNAQDGDLFAELTEKEDPTKAASELSADGQGGRNGSANGMPRVEIAMGAVRSGFQQPPITQSPRGNSRQTQGANRSNQQPGTLARQPQPRAQPNTFNVHDSDSFPTLGGRGAKPSSAKKKAQTPTGSDFSEISGDNARAYLEEVKRKKYEAEAESVATSAAGWVLDGDD